MCQFNYSKTKSIPFLNKLATLDLYFELYNHNRDVIMKNILIAGGTGLVGRELTYLLLKNGYKVAYLSRSSDGDSSIKRYVWDYKKEYIDLKALHWADVIINLAGYSVSKKRWSKQVKEEIYNSRVLATRFIREELQKNEIHLEHYISASATGIYEYEDVFCDENSRPASNFLADVVTDWEKESLKFTEIKVPASVLRIGLVLSNKGGALTQLAQPIELRVGANLGTGKQPMSWIHVKDLTRMFMHVLENKENGIFNAVGGVCMHSEMNKAIADQLGRKIWMPNVPPFVLKIMLGEMSSMVLNGNSVSNEKIKSTGFKFLYENLESSLKDLLS